MPNETMEQETQTAAPDTASETSAEVSVGGEDAGVSETSESVETESQDKSQEGPATGDNGPDDQPVAPPSAESAVAPEARYAAVEKENAEMRAILREMAELQKSEQQAKLAERAQKTATPKGAWKETLAKAYKPEDANVLSSAMEAMRAELLQELGVDSLKQDVQFMKPHLERMGYENEITRAGAALVAAGIPQSVVAKLRPDVDAAYKSGIVAPPEMVMWSAYAKLAAKDKTALATKTLQARTQTKPKPPAPKNLTGPTNPAYSVPNTITDPRERIAHLLKQFEK